MICYDTDKTSYVEFGKDTRVWFLDRVQTWLADKQTNERAFWLRGGAGLGKSVMAGLKYFLFNDKLNI